MNKIYLAIPYKNMEESSFKQATLSAKLIIDQYKCNVFSPITHSHPLHLIGLRGDWEFWREIDFQYLEWCNELWINIPEEGIDRILNSTGVMAEIAKAKELNIPIKSFFIDDNKVILTDSKLEYTLKK